MPNFSNGYQPVPVGFPSSTNQPHLQGNNLPLSRDNPYIPYNNPYFPSHRLGALRSPCGFSSATEVQLLTVFVSAPQRLPMDFPCLLCRKQVQATITKATFGTIKRIQQRDTKQTFINSHQRAHWSGGPGPGIHGPDLRICTQSVTVHALRAGSLADFMASKIQRRGPVRLGCQCCRPGRHLFFIAENACCKICCFSTCKMGRAGDQSSPAVALTVELQAHQ